MTRVGTSILENSFQTINPSGASSVVLVCEHAAHFIPAQFDNLGLPSEVRKSHVAWDPGAMEVARRLSEKLDAALVAGTVSRLVYDCNRPPSSPAAMPERSEIIDIPGNQGLNASARQERVEMYYEPFRAALSDRIKQTENPVMVTIHSFTPIYHGARRSVEIGVLHDTDSRLADAMLQSAAAHTQANVQRNQPYGVNDGVTHTLQEHAIPGGHANVMLEIRNDIIETRDQQRAMGDMLAGWLADAFSQTGVKGNVQCVA